MLGWQETPELWGTARTRGRGRSGGEAARGLHRRSSVCLGLGSFRVRREEGQMERCIKRREAGKNVFREQGGSQDEYKAVRNGHPLTEIKNKYWCY